MQKRLFLTKVLSRLILLVCLLPKITPLFAQANDWYFPPDIRMNAVNGTFSNFSWSSDITYCTTSNSQQGVLSDGSGTNYRAFNFCSIYNFDGTNINPSNWGSDMLFTVPGLCNQYWDISWKYASTTPYSLKLSITKYNAPDPTMMEFIEELEITPTDDEIPDGECAPTGSWDIAVAPLANDGSRKIYAVLGSGLISWTIDLNGNINYDGLLATLPYSVNHQVRMEVTSDGEHVLMNPCGYQGVMIYDLFPQPDQGASNVRLINVGRIISGYEFVPGSLVGGSDRLYVSSHNATAPYGGGIEYFDFATGSGPSSPFTYSVPSVFGFTELELAKNGLLYFAYNPTFGSGYVIGAGDLYYFDPAWANTSSPILAASGGEVSTYFNWGYYIQRQIDGENYDYMNAPLLSPTFTINGQTDIGLTPPTLWMCNNNYDLQFDATLYNATTGYKIEVIYGPGVGGAGWTSVASTGIIGGYGVPVQDLASTFAVLNGYVGYIDVILTIYDACGSNLSSATQRFNIQSATASVNFTMKAPGNYPDQGRNTSLTFGSLTQPAYPPLPNVLGWLGANYVAVQGYNTPSSTGVNTTSIVAEEVNPTTGAPIPPKIVDYNQAGSIGSTTSHPLNFLSGISGVMTYGWFQNNYNTIKNNKVFKVTVTINTPGCGDVSNYSYFKIIDGGAGGAYYKTTSAATIEELQEEFIAYPNPTHEILNIEWNSSKVNADASILIMDILGKIVVNKLIIEEQGRNKSSIDITNLSNGIYQYKLITDSGTTTGKFVKE